MYRQQQRRLMLGEKQKETAYKQQAQGRAMAWLQQHATHQHLLKLVAQQDKIKKLKSTIPVKNVLALDEHAMAKAGLSVH